MEWLSDATTAITDSVCWWLDSGDCVSSARQLSDWALLTPSHMEIRGCVPPIRGGASWGLELSSPQSSEEDPVLGFLRQRICLPMVKLLKALKGQWALASFLPCPQPSPVCGAMHWPSTPEPSHWSGMGFQPGLYQQLHVARVLGI
jgi:hypothetical protein